MDQQERDELLWRLDERTKKVDDHLSRLDERLEEAEEDIDEHDEKISSNEDSIRVIKKAASAGGTGIFAFLSAIGAKVAGLLHI